MPRVHNPAGFPVYCTALGRLLRAGERIEVTGEQARGITRTVFVVEDESSGASERKHAKRGSKTAEVTASPRRETR